MKIFIWQRVKKCSAFYHPEGGVVVIAGCEQRAREISKNLDEYGDGCDIDPLEKPTFVCECSAKEEKVFTFPDAGCC
jgi:hypothetical protein